MPADDSRALDIALDSGAMLRVLPVSAHVFRVRLRPDGQFPEPGLVRYGVIRADTPDVPVTVTDPARLVISARRGALDCYLIAGQDLPELLDHYTQITGRPTLLPLWGYGLGDEARDRLNKRGHETPMVLRNVVSYAPIPFLMSTGGWAIFVNSTWFHHVDAGATDPDRLVISSRRGELDCYLIAGQDLPELLDHYTQITGRPTLLPLWGYGLTWVCDERGARARDVLYEANRFRTEGIPLDAIGLEPGWMQTRYDFSVEPDRPRTRGAAGRRPLRRGRHPRPALHPEASGHHHEVRRGVVRAPQEVRGQRGGGVQDGRGQPSVLPPGPQVAQRYGG
jgi:hypothetical protein